MLVLVPQLFPSRRLLDVAAQGLRLPALESVLARGTPVGFCEDGLEAALCQRLGIQKQQDWPVAPVALQADGGAPGSDWWLRADPVHLAVMRDRIVLGDNAMLRLGQDEADALAASIAAHFGAEFSPQPLRPLRWYLRLPQPPQLETTPLSCATGREVGPLLPRGAEALSYRTLMNELQMLLHAHPVNLAREARGELPVNSLWLWGGGTLPEVAPCGLRLAADDTDARMLANFAGATVQPLASAFGREGADIAVLDTLVAAAQGGDALALRAGLQEVEARLQALLGGTSGFTLADPLCGLAWAWRTSNRLKFWRRRLPLAAALPAE